MTLSNRCWRAIAWRFRESFHPAELKVVGLVFFMAIGKRHAIRTIPLKPDERAVVQWLLLHPKDDYLRFVIRHERATNPGLPL